MEERKRTPVTLPRPNPTTSYWQDPPDGIADLRSTADLPKVADVIIIGSGITGAAVAWHLLESSSAASPGPDIVMLEARQICSGATGRNGGHTKAASYRSFLDNAASLPGGTATAAQIARLELANIRAVHEFAAVHGIECDSAPCDTVDVVRDEGEWLRAVEAVEAMRRAMPGEAAAEYELLTPGELRGEGYLCGDLGDGISEGDGGRPWEGERLYGGVRYAAGSLSAYAFTVGVLKLCMGRGMKIYANTPAVRLERQGPGGGGGGGMWRVSTAESGAISAGRVVLATNGYTAALDGRFQGAVVPVRGQVAAQRPGRGMPQRGLPLTYSFIYEGGYEYMVTRPGGSRFEGDVVIGGGLARSDDEGGLGQWGTTDDGAVSGRISEYLRGTTPRYFGRNWGEDHPDGRVRMEWTGIMGFSPDGYPFVGQVPGDGRADAEEPDTTETGLWASCSFQGHGMVLCWMSARALVEMMEGRDGPELEEWFPAAFCLTRERMARRFVEP